MVRSQRQGRKRAWSEQTERSFPRGHGRAVLHDAVFCSQHHQSDLDESSLARLSGFQQWPGWLCPQCNSGLNEHGLTYNLGPTTSQNITGLSDGNYSACLTPVDEADNYGQASCTTTSLWVDTTAPTLQAWSDVAGWTTSTRVNVSWEAYDSSQTTEVRYNLDSSGFSQAFSENDTVMLSSLSVGLHHVLVRANDSAGNTQEVLVTFGVDVAGPTIVASHDLGPLWTNQTQHTITWNITDAHSGVERISLYQSGSLVATNLSANGSWAFNLTAGVHNLSIFAVDEVGHESWWTTNARVDTATPSVSCLVSPAGWSNTMPSFYLNILANGSLSNVAHVATYDGVLFSANLWMAHPAHFAGRHPRGGGHGLKSRWEQRDMLCQRVLRHHASGVHRPSSAACRHGRLNVEPQCQR